MTSTERPCFKDQAGRSMRGRLGALVAEQGAFAVYALPAMHRRTEPDHYALFWAPDFPDLSRRLLLLRGDRPEVERLYRLCSGAEHTPPQRPQRRFRMAVDASICFDVLAVDEADAVAAANDVVLRGLEGFDVSVDAHSGDDGSPDGRAYFKDAAVPTIEDVTDAD